MRISGFVLASIVIGCSGSAVAAQSAPPSRSEWEAAILHGRSRDSMLTADNRRLFLAARLARLDSLNHELRGFGRIQSMSDGLRYYTDLNGATVTTDSARLNPASPAYERWVQPLATVLARDSIPAATYEALRQQLIRTGFVKVAVQPGYTAFLFDGFVAHGNGLIKLDAGAPVPAVQTELFDEGLTRVDEVAPGWYYFEL